MNIKNIIWDFNGTLLDDTDICIDSINPLLTKRNLLPINKVIYQDAFTFPVEDYYKAIGFDFSKEDFKIPAMQFIDNYTLNLPKAQLFPKVSETLAQIKSMGINQYVLSAMQEPFLRKTLKELDIASYFKEMAGIQDHYAKGKIERGIKLFESNNINPKESLLIGDTLHDKEVAESLGIKSILIANGHQSEKRLKKQTDTVVTDLNHIFPYLKPTS